MPENVQDVTLEILKSIQTGVGGIKTRLDHIESRLDQLDAGLRKDRGNVAGVLVAMRATAGDFDETAPEVEERVAALGARRH